MRHTTKTHEANQTVTSNPATLYSKDIQAFAVTKEYRQALRTKQTAKCANIREANKDLEAYFNFIDGAAKRNPYYEV